MTPAAAPANPLLEIAITIVAPALVLMQLSGEAQLGAVPALLLALTFPLAWGLMQLHRKRSFGLMAGIGVFSTLLTGGVGLLQLDAQWLAVKEAAVPLVLGLAVAGSAWTRRPLIHLLVYNASVFDVPKVEQALSARDAVAAFEEALRRATLWLSGTFFFSAAMNYGLARWLVTSPAGSEAFNEELGRFTLLAYPMIALPSMAMMMALLVWLGRRAHALTGLSFGEMLVASVPSQR